MYKNSFLHWAWEETLRENINKAENKTEVGDDRSQSDKLTQTERESKERRQAQKKKNKPSDREDRKEGGEKREN